MSHVLYKPQPEDIETSSKLLQELVKMINLPPTGIGSTPLYPWLLWNLWKTWNQLVFENRSYSEEETLLKSIREAREWHQAQSHLTKPVKSATARPIPRLPEVSNGFVDAAWIASTDDCRMGWLFTNAEQDDMFQGTFYRRHVGSALCAEALALKGALEDAIAAGIQELNMFSDSQALKFIF
ncbi:unnamed protein product [Arabis nemorensis]|uniref:RNase H type-1 domain-containing protein n=1 Tax=Arabis nemorensis TaxID=586526 RepID=A0A565CFG5_9BRAS|nr:unnamed protein product [Arabis nemorensis]